MQHGKMGGKQFVKGRVMRKELSNSGYLMVKFSVNGKQVHRYVHRMVAISFLPNLNNLPEVNHIDCNKINNTLSNLEWCTPQQNIAYREKYGISAKEATKALRHPVYAVNLETFEVLYFPSYKEASRQLKIDATDISKVVKGQQKYSKGYWFTDGKNKIIEEKIREIKK